MHHRLRHAPEQQVDPHASPEQHGEPREQPELRRRVRPTEPDLAVAAEREDQHEGEEQGGQQQVQPAESGDDTVHDRTQRRAERLGERHADDDERHRDAHRYVEDRAELAAHLLGTAAGCLVLPDVRHALHILSRRLQPAAFGLPLWTAAAGQIVLPPRLFLDRDAAAAGARGRDRSRNLDL